MSDLINWIQVTCMTCGHYEDEMQECRKNPPTIARGEKGIFKGEFPEIKPYEFCSQWVRVDKLYNPETCCRAKKIQEHFAEKPDEEYQGES